MKQDGDFLCFLNGASKKVANYDEFVSNLDSSCLWMFRKGYNIANGNVIGNANDDSLYRSHESSIWKNGPEKNWYPTIDCGGDTCTKQNHAGTRSIRIDSFFSRLNRFPLYSLLRPLFYTKNRHSAKKNCFICGERREEGSNKIFDRKKKTSCCRSLIKKDCSCLWMFRKGYNVANGNVIGNENDDSLYRSHESSI